jgi:uncharacterized protein YqgV (UPF0045/DUF77 family)
MMNMRAACGSNDLIAIAVRESKIQEEEDDFVTVDLITPEAPAAAAPPTQLTNESVNIENLLNQGFTEEWLSNDVASFDEELLTCPRANQSNVNSQGDDWMSKSLELRMINAADAVNNEEMEKKKKITVLQNTIVQPARVQRPTSPILSGNCAARSQMNSNSSSSPANGGKLRRLLQQNRSLSAKKRRAPDSAVTSGSQRRQRISLAVGSQQVNDEELLSEETLSQTQKEWIADFEGENHRDVMTEVYALWRSLKREDIQNRREIRKSSKSVTTLQAEIDQEREIVRAAERRIAQKSAEMVALQISVEQLERRQESCRLQLQHFKKFSK